MFDAVTATPVNSDLYTTQVCADLLHAWTKAAGDPDSDEIHRWLTSGAPQGILARPANTGIFPALPSEGHDADAWESLGTDFDGFMNHSTVESDPAAAIEIQRLIDHTPAFVKTFPSLAACTAWLGGTPVLSKMGMITKEKPYGSLQKLVPL